MQHSVAAPTSPASRSFAGLLADLAAPEQKFPPARDLDGLADDIATLTYEHALRTHARYRPSHVELEASDTQPGTPDKQSYAQPCCGTLSKMAKDPDPKPDTRTVPVAVPASDRKNASVTVRLSCAENDQLRQRAREAGITLSAYLRSCAFEVESLRAQVKQTLAELRSSEAPSAQHTSVLSKLIPWRRRAVPPAQS